MAKSDKNQPDNGKRAGEVRHDSRGHAVWHWASETARNAAISTSQLLRRLDLSGLSLEDERSPETPPKAAPEATDKAASGKAGPRLPGATPPAAGAGDLRLDKTGRPGAPRGYNPYGGATVRPAPVARSRPGLAKPARTSWWRRLFQRR